MNLREIFRRALKDPRMDIDVLVPSSYPTVGSAIKGLSDDVRISEWKHTLGSARYEYHVHTGEIAKEIERLYGGGIRGGNPTLVRVFSKGELESLIHDAAVA